MVLGPFGSLCTLTAGFCLARGAGGGGGGGGGGGAINKGLWGASVGDMIQVLRRGCCEPLLGEVCPRSPHPLL